MVVFTDLKNAITTVLVNALPCRYDAKGKPTRYDIGVRELKNLQEEYNIYFIEPEKQQLEIL